MDGLLPEKPVSEANRKRQRVAAFQLFERWTWIVGSVRRALASYWTAGLALAAMSWLHWRWLWRTVHAGDVLSSYGAGLVALGVLVGSRPYLRAGFAQLVEAGLPQDDAGYLVGPDYLRELERKRQTARPQAIRDVLA